MEYKIALIPGDGIGPEIVAEAKKVLDRVCEKYSHKFSYTEVLLGGASIDAHGVPLTEEAIAQAKASDAVLMGSIGGDAKTSPWYKLEPSKRPEAGLLAIRKALNLFANLRPAYLYNELRDACPLRDEIIGDGFDMIIVRELTGGLYFGERKTIEEDIDYIEKVVAQCPPVSKLINEGKSPEEILKQLFDDVEITEKQDLFFKCDCSKEKMGKALITVGKEEVQAMIDEDHGGELSCQFCNKRYQFSEEELKELAHKCSLNTGGHKGSAKVLYEADMLAIYEMAK